MLDLSKYPNVRAVNIIKENQLLFEYTRANELKTELFSVGCIFKSFLAVLVGMAINEGKIKSIEDFIIDYVSHKETANANWHKLKIKHALSKTTGLVWPGPRDPMPATMQEVMELSFESEPGFSFRYKPDPQIIVYLLEEIYELEITKLFETKIIKYFADSNYEWDREDIQGMKVSIRLLNELGQLMLNKGMHNGKRIFSEEYCNQMIEEHSCGGFPEGVPYGLSWWCEKKSNVSCFSACGFGGQKLVIVPQKEMIVSILSDMDRPHPENNEIIEMALQM